jgi:aryl-alcohol dehydrogenase-like predicted oxidoreductase
MLAAAEARPRLCASPLILGGHSFIEPLGRDPEPSCEQKRAIVSGCLQRGMRLFDTTYAPERTELGRSLSSEPAEVRDAACPIIWNFFGPMTDPLPEPCAWTEARLSEATADLRPWTGRPIVVIHALGEPAADRRQFEAVCGWKRDGRVAALGLWPGDLDGWSAEDVSALDFIVAPWNFASVVKTRPQFKLARARGLVTVGASPFTRGWEVDRLAKRLAVLEQRPVAEARMRVADALLRFAAFSPEVDHLIVAMREPDYVRANFDSLSRGPLTLREQRWIEGLGRTMSLKYQR